MFILCILHSKASAFASGNLDCLSVWQHLHKFHNIILYRKFEFMQSDTHKDTKLVMQSLLGMSKSEGRRKTIFQYIGICTIPTNAF